MKLLRSAVHKLRSGKRESKEGALKRLASCDSTTSSQGRCVGGIDVDKAGFGRQMSAPSSLQVGLAVQLNTSTVALSGASSEDSPCANDMLRIRGPMAGDDSSPFLRAHPPATEAVCVSACSSSDRHSVAESSSHTSNFDEGVIVPGQLLGPDGQMEKIPAQQDVWVARYRGTPVAVERVELPHTSPSHGVDYHSVHQALLGGWRLFRQLAPCNYIVRCHGIVVEPPLLAAVSEVCWGGSLHMALLSDAATQYHWSHRGLQVATDLCKALRVLADAQVVHGELNTHHVWLTEDGTAKLKPGLTPSLTSAALRSSNFHARTTDARKGLLGLRHALSPAFPAPEQIRGEQLTCAVDVYLLGVLLTELLVGHPLPDAADPLAELRLLQDQPLQRGVQLARSCLEDLPWNRPTLGAIHAVLQQELTARTLQAQPLSPDPVDAAWTLKQQPVQRPAQVPGSSSHAPTPSIRSSPAVVLGTLASDESGTSYGSAGSGFGDRTAEIAQPSAPLQPARRSCSTPAQPEAQRLWLQQAEGRHSHSFAYDAAHLGSGHSSTEHPSGLARHATRCSHVDGVTGHRNAQSMDTVNMLPPTDTAWETVLLGRAGMLHTPFA